MSEHDHELDAFLGDVNASMERDLSEAPIEPDFEAMLARATAMAESESPTPDPELDDFLSEVAGHVDADDGGVAPDFLAVVARAHDLDPNVVPQAAVDEVGTYAPIISLRDAARLRQGHDDPELDDFVRDVRGHVDHDLATGDAAHRDETPAERRRVYGFAAAAALLLALGLGAGLATFLDLGGGMLWDSDGDRRSEAMFSPQPAPTQETEVIAEAPVPDPVPVPVPVPEPDPEPEVEAEDTADPAPKRRRKPKAKAPSRRDRLAALEAEANAAWKAGRLDAAEAAFRKIIALDPKGSWGESAYGELFTLQRQRGRSSIALWKTYLKRFPKGRFADDAQAGLCRRAEGETKVKCWTAYLDDRPRGSFRRQAQRELDEAKAAKEPTP